MSTLYLIQAIAEQYNIPLYACKEYTCSGEFDNTKHVPLLLKIYRILKKKNDTFQKMSQTISKSFVVTVHHAFF